jgi:hypothetical protein
MISFLNKLFFKLHPAPPWVVLVGLNKEVCPLGLAVVSYCELAPNRPVPYPYPPWGFEERGYPEKLPNNPPPVA